MADAATPLAAAAAVTPAARRAVMALPAGALLLSLVAVCPALGVLVVWPLLFAVPGWLLAARAAPALSPVGRAGVAVAASIFGSTHLVYALGRLHLGVGAAVILLAAGLLMAATVVLATLPMAGLAPPPRVSLAATLTALRRHRVAFGIAAASALIVGGVLRLSAWHLGPDGYISGGWNWSDLLVHVSIASSLQHGNFPPQVPFFAGVPLTYHWFGDFHAAIASTSAGADLISVMVVSNALLAGALALLAYELALVLTNHRRVAALTPVLLLFGGGMGFIRLPLDMAQGRGSLVELLSSHSYDNAWVDSFPYFRIASVFGTGLLDQRATAYGLPGVVAVVLLVHLCWGRTPSGVLLAGALAALLAPFQLYAFPTLYLMVIIQLAARRAWREPTFWRDCGLFFVPLAWSAQFVAGGVGQQHSQGSVHLVQGWPDAPLKDGPLALAFFYGTNLGVPFLLAVTALLRRRLPHRALLAGWLVAIFAVPNLVVVSSSSFDSNKFFQVMAIVVALLAAWMLRDWPRPLVALALVASLLSPLLVGIWHVRSTTVALTVAQVDAGHWIEDNTPERTVFVTDSFVNSPVDIAGRLRLTTFGPYIDHLGYDPTTRLNDVERIYCAGDATAASLMRGYGAGYVVSGGIECGGATRTQFAQSAYFETVYDVGGVTIWRLRG